jgi:hypothetical protein
MCSIGKAFGALGQVAQFASDSQKVAADNTARTANRVAAIDNYNSQIAGEDNNYLAQTKSTNEQGFDVAVASRQAASTARAQAATLGAAGISVQGIQNEIAAKMGSNAGRIQDAQDNHLLTLKNKLTDAHTTATSQINANQPVEGPSPLSLLIGIGSSALG